MIKKIISLLCVCSILLTSIPTSVLAKSSTYSTVDYESVEDYIAEAITVETLDFDGNDVIYYHGENYCVVEDGSDYYLIIVDQEGLTLNGMAVEMLTENTDDQTNMQSFASDWTFFKEGSTSVNIAGLALSAAVGVASTAFQELASSWQAILKPVAILGYMPNFCKITNFYTAHVRVIDEYIGLMEWRYQNNIYLSVISSNLKQTFIKSYTTYRN